MRESESTKIVVLGSTGMAGHVVCTRLSQRPELQVFNVARRPWNDDTIILDARDGTALERVIRDINPDIIINCMGVLIKGSEKDPTSAIKVNSLLPHLLVDLCDRYGGRLIHLSTDCVFSGKNGPYRPTDQRDGDSIYDRTKALGEVVNERDLTVRTSITGPELEPSGQGLFNWFMKQRGPVRGFSKAMWSRVMTTQLAQFMEDICLGYETSKGLVHYSVPGGISKYDLLALFKSEFDTRADIERFDSELVDKRLLPSESLRHLPPDYPTQIRNMRSWMVKHRNFYAHYDWKGSM